MAGSAHKAEDPETDFEKEKVRKAFSMDAEDVLACLDVDPDSGLTSKDVEERQARFGENRLRKSRSKGAFSILARQFSSVIVWLLVAGAVFSVVIGDVWEAAAIGVVLLINTAIGFLTELRATRSMEALREISEFTTRVRRDGETPTIEASALTRGDIVLLNAGDVVTADLRLIKADNLHCDESALTGESSPVAKSTDVLDAETALADRVNVAFKGTAVAEGDGEGVVVATGMDTEIGEISELAEKAEGEVSPLQKRLDRLGHRLLWLSLFVTAVIVLAGIARGRGLVDMVETGIALAVATVPEGLPVVATLCLARGMWRLADRNALIRNLSSVETLGATTVILTDKTGTLTENEMTVVRYVLSGDDEVEKGDDEEFSAGEDERLAWALRIGALCNNAEMEDGSGGEGSSGDPMEVALLKAAAAAGLGRDMLLEDLELEKEHPFDQDLNMMATVHRDDGEYLYAVKGAPEAVIETCARVLTSEDETELDDDGRSDWMQRAEKVAAKGLRLLGLARKRASSADDEPYEDLTLVGLVCLLDPIREDVPDAIAAGQAAGVRIVMLTGDHANTAATIAADAGLTNGEAKVATSKDLSCLGENAGGGRQGIGDIEVFARVAPQAKLEIVKFYQAEGEVVAMTGDGVNDAPALKKADIGIAMGQRGTEVAREAADMVLKDDAFSTIVEAMRQGRAIYDNIRKLVVFLLACNLSEILVLGLAIGVGLPSPLTALQILYLNLVTDVFPALALGFGRGDRHIMDRPPRKPDEPLLDGSRWRWIAGLGGSITTVTLGAFGLSLYWLGHDTPQAVTVAFLTLALSQNWNVFSLRAAGSNAFVNDITTNPYIWGALATCIVLITTAVALPPLSALLNLPFPGLGGVALAVGAALVHVVIGQLGLSLASR